MFVMFRAGIYATCFIAILLIAVPARLLARAGITGPADLGAPELVGVLAAILGAAVSMWCILTFVRVGRGTPAPFDPPRRLVVRGPYRLVRNPMYLGAALALAGATIVYHSVALLGYLVALGVVTQGLVTWYEEPTLNRLFGSDYEAYRREVRRWLPRLPGR
jgi:protein-S-isoprenylcysteine O-methyltransferase Ste14